MVRQKFPTRTIYLSGSQQVNTILQLVPNLPIDPDHPLEVVIREKVEVRKPSANSAFWAGPMKDIAEQVWVEGRRYSAKVWAEEFKEEFLPEEFDPELTLEGYVKWGFDRKGRKILVGSTTDLTSRGFALYRRQVEA